MYKRSAAKRTGIYRVSGDMSDFRMEIKLRHISEWLPVPKFEYSGAKTGVNNGESAERVGGSWADFCIYVPHEDLHGNHYNYYNYYNPGSEYPSSGLASACRSYASSSSSAFSGNGAAAEASASSSSAQLAQSGSDFYALNRELCNGGTAKLCLSWQQKHFSRAELQRFAAAAQCATPLQRRYQRWARDILQQQQAAAQHQQRLRRRRARRSRKHGTLLSSEEEGVAGGGAEDGNFAARSCLIHTLTDAELQEEQLQLDPTLQSEIRELQGRGFQLMYVFAQLQQDTLLFALRYAAAEGLLYVYPDFNFSADDMDYVLEIDNDCRQLYAYGFQNITPLRSCSAASREQRQQRIAAADGGLPPANASAEQLLAHYQRQREQAEERRRLREFCAPPKRMRRVALLLQLQQAQHFEYPNIHVRYYVNPPLHTLLEPAQPDEPFPLRGSTATCVGGGSGSAAHFSHCWQLTLLCEESHQADQLLHIYFEVISIDGWQRERCEGYAHFSCSLLAPLPPALLTGIRLQCIRPVGSWLDALNRYFIGGRTLFDFVGYFNGSTRGSPVHSRMELHESCGTRSTGTLLFSMRKLQQRHLQLGHYLDMYDSDEDNHLRPQLAPSTTLDEVLAAYVEARDRIEALLGRPTSH